MHDKEHNHAGCCGGHNHSHNHAGCCGGHNHSHNHEGCCEEHFHNSDIQEEYMTLLLENDEEVKCSVIDIFDVEENEYIALLPVGDDQVLLYRYIETEDSFELKNIETDEEFEQVEQVFFSLFDEEFEEEYEYEEEE